MVVSLRFWQNKLKRAIVRFELMIKSGCRRAAAKIACLILAIERRIEMMGQKIDERIPKLWAQL